MVNRKYIVGNWKMNGLTEQLSDISDIATVAMTKPGVDVGIAPPVTLISEASKANRELQIGAQDWPCQREWSPYRQSLCRHAEGSWRHFFLSLVIANAVLIMVKQTRM